MCQPSQLWKTSDTCLAQCPEAYAIVNCKSLYDLIQKTRVAQCQEYRTRLEALIITDRIKEGICIKWADSLTKSMDCSTLRDFLAKGRCIIHDVDEVLRARADKRSKKAWMSHVAAPSEVANTCQLNQCTAFEEHKTHLENTFWRVWCATCAISQWEVHWNTFICDCRTRLRCPGGCGTWRKGLCRWPSHRWDRVPPLEFNRIRRSSHTTIYIRSGGLIQFNPDSFGLGKTYCFGLRKSLPIQQYRWYIYIYIILLHIYIYWFINLFLAKRWPRSVHICALILQGR